MKTFNPEMLNALKKIMKLIAQTFGNKCEVVLHEWANGYEHSIIAIENGHVTGRKVGDCGSNLGLEIMRGSVQEGDSFNYVTRTNDGKILKSSTIYLKDEDNTVCGALCVNIDITHLLQGQEEVNTFIGDLNPSSQSEFHAKDVNELTDYLLNQAISNVGIPVKDMTKENKIEVIRFLDQKGLFLITKSGNKTCKILNISKYTLYSYLDIVRNSK